jgi:hypothetical protein
MKRFYNTLLRLYPRDYRAMFEKEMRRAFEMTSGERGGDWAFIVRELTGLALGVLSEWFAKLTTDQTARARVLPDLVLMRPPGVAREIHFGAAILPAAILPAAILDDDRCSSDT